MLRRLSLLVAVGAVCLVVAVPQAAAGGSCHAPADVKLSTGGDTAAHIGECAFQPTVTYIEPGESVTWTNKDVFDHTVTGAANSWGNESPLSQGDKVSYAFKKEGVYPYYCAYHPSMVGAVVVGDASNAAALTNGVAAVQPVDADTDSGSVGVAVETSSSQTSPLVFVLASVALLGIAGLVWRTLNVRRRAAAATPAP